MDVKTRFCYKNQSDILPGEISKQSKPLISVIVPVFKVEDVLVRCLDSLCRQSLQDIEIILVDDDSPDRCGEIYEQYAVQDERIRVIRHPKNRGLSAARNTGIAHSSADYLMFVDSDDWVHEDFCKLPYECAVKHQADMVVFCYQRIGKDGSSRPIKKAGNRTFGKLTHMEAIESLLYGAAGSYPWNKLYSRKLFNTVSYPEGYFYEGTGTVYKTVLLADTVFYLDEVLYYYCYRDGSITTLKTEKALQDYFEMSLQQYRDLVAWGYPAERLEFLLHNIMLNYCIKKKPYSDDANLFFCKKTLLSAKKIPEGFPWRRKVMFVLLKYCPPLFEAICVLYDKKEC